ncbi:MAG: DivIVA domain-containing protein [Pseudomonadota bacterium]
MRITPMDIQQQQFRIRFRGFDVQEVDSFLELVASELKEVFHENSSLKDEIKRLQDAQAMYQEKEKTFQTAFISAQRVIDEMKENAQRQGKLILTQAEVEAARLLQQAETRASQIQEEIARLKQQRVQLEYRVKSFINSLHAWFSAERDADKDLEDEQPAGQNAVKGLKMSGNTGSRTVSEDVESGHRFEVPGANRTIDTINEIISEVNLERAPPPR